MLNLLGVVEGHGWTDGKGEFFVGDALGDGEGEVVPLSVAGLAVWGDGVMDEGLDALLSEVIAEGITTAVAYEDGEEMPDGFFAWTWLWQGDVVGGEIGEVVVGNLSAAGVVLIKVFQFDVEDGGL